MTSCLNPLYSIFALRLFWREASAGWEGDLQEKELQEQPMVYIGGDLEQRAFSVNQSIQAMTFIEVSELGKLSTVRCAQTLRGKVPTGLGVGAIGRHHRDRGRVPPQHFALCSCRSPTTQEHRRRGAKGMYVGKEASTTAHTRLIATLHTEDRQGGIQAQAQAMTRCAAPWSLSSEELRAGATAATAARVRRSKPNCRPHGFALYCPHLVPALRVRHQRVSPFGT